MGGAQSQSEPSYSCAQHHDHRSMEDVRQCNQYHNNRGGDSHVENMADKFIAAHKQGAIDSSVVEAALTNNSIGERKAIQD